jgi:hypothetical protein
MDFRNDIGTLFELAFGVKMPVFIPYPLEVNRQNLPSFKLGDNTVNDLPGYNDVRAKTEASNARKSHFGLPIFSPIAFIGRQYKKFDKYGVLQTVSMPDFSMPATTLVDFSRSKILAETPQNAGEGAVVEMFGFENWAIRIRGLCIMDQAHPTHKTAQEQKEEILNWEGLASGIYVAGDVFTEKNIEYIIIKSINISQLEGRPNVVPFEMNCIGHTAPELQYP